LRFGGFVTEGIMLSAGLLWESTAHSYEIPGGANWQRIEVEEKGSSFGVFAGPRIVAEFSDPVYGWVGLDVGYLSGENETTFSGQDDSFTSRAVSETFVQPGLGLKFAIGRRHGAFIELQAAARLSWQEEEASQLLEDEPVSLIFSLGGGGFFNTN